MDKNVITDLPKVLASQAGQSMTRDLQKPTFLNVGDLHRYACY